MITKNAHTHKFNKLITKKVPVTAGLKTAVDELKMYECACGKQVAYDLERTIK